LYERIRRLIEDKGFKSVSDYVTYVLREIVAMHEAEAYEEPFTEEDLEEIKRRLRALGYI
jgi:Arc/MetJ-type ribon-helix-helix transcriptional regulator